MYDGDSGVSCRPSRSSAKVQLSQDLSSKHISRDTTPTRRVSHQSTFETREDTDIRPSPSTLHTAFMPLRPVDPYVSYAAEASVVQ